MAGACVLATAATGFMQPPGSPRFSSLPILPTPSRPHCRRSRPVALACSRRQQQAPPFTIASGPSPRQAPSAEEEHDDEEVQIVSERRVPTSTLDLAPIVISGTPCLVPKRVELARAVSVFPLLIDGTFHFALNTSFSSSRIDSCYNAGTTEARMESFPLLSLPTELLLAVVEAIDDAASLRSFALTCKLARLLAEPVLYRAILVTTGSEASWLAQALKPQKTATRAVLVQELDLRPEDSDEDLEALTPLVGAMTQLRALSMESPFANYGQWDSSESDAQWEPLTQGFRALFLDAQCGAGLQKLQSCEIFSWLDPVAYAHRAEVTIHWLGDTSRFWLLKEFKPILTLPALQSLTLSCAVLEDGLINGLAAFSGTTPLIHLELIECFVSQKALAAVLALPRALQSCHLGIMRYHTPPSKHGHEASPEQQLEALCQQRHSLQELTWFDRYFAYETDVGRVPVPGKGLYDFTELNTLTLDGASSLLFSTLLSECAPPNLDRLRIIRHDTCTILDHPPDSVTHTRIPGIPPPVTLRTHLPSLHHLDLVIAPEPGYMTEPIWAKPDRRDRVKGLGEDYHTRGIGLAIFTAAAGRESIIPPYLFGEEPPCEEPAYRTENGSAWFAPEMA
ncbi:hypothetical protein K438DRAFT_1985711 [Mycena galopus ATCC 62051]|nr:hypothetical protein K438DRAFT_1985711 [Mycena galopus ATCC 62051]